MNLINRLHQIFKRQHLSLPQSSNDIPEYAVSFMQAVAFTTSCGFRSNALILNEGDALDSEGKFAAPIFHEMNVDVSKSAGQCLKWCHFMEPLFQRHLGCKVWVTLGQVWRGDDIVFSPSWADLRKWSSQGIPLEDFNEGRGFNLHAWLTVESGEIIDPTYPSSLAAYGGPQYKELKGGIVWGRDPEILDCRYFPMAVGQQFVNAIAQKTVVPLLATSTEELEEFPLVEIIACT